MSILQKVYELAAGQPALGKIVRFCGEFEGAIRARIELHRRIINLNFTMKYYEGVPVFKDNVLIQGYFGIMPHNAGACIVTNGEGKPEIYVNSGFWLLAVEHQHAILTHELGHFHMGHKGSLFTHLLRGFGQALNFEYQADLYAHNVGMDMLGALKALQNQQTFKSVELTKRIARLEEIKCLPNLT